MNIFEKRWEADGIYIVIDGAVFVARARNPETAQYIVDLFNRKEVIQMAKAKKVAAKKAAPKAKVARKRGRPAKAK